MNNVGQSALAHPKENGILGDFFWPVGRLIGKILQFLLILLIIAIIILSIFVGYRYFKTKQETGQLASAVTHGEVSVQESLSPLAGFANSISPELCSALFPSECTYNPYAIDSVVEVSSTTKDLGVKVTEFEPVAEFFRPNSDINLLGKIKVKGLDKPINLEAYCSLEGYRDEELIPAQLSGLQVTGNQGTVFEGEEVEFIAQCNFPGGMQAEKQVTSKKAKLVLLYDFTTKAYQRVWFLEKPALLQMQKQGVDPFELYSVNDPLLDSEKKIRSKTTPGPVNLGLQIDFPQPLAENTIYLLLVQLSRTAELGNLQKLNYLTIEVPSVPELDLILEGEETLLGNTQCDFEYIGPSPKQGFKEYRLSDIKLQEVNQDCDKKSLRELALSERDCIEFYKEPLFVCNFKATIVPSTLTSDTIRAEANYVYKVEKQSVVDIRALPSELVA